MGRSAAGVKGITLRDGDFVVGADVRHDDEEILVITENGFGKRTSVTEYPIKGRGGKGIKTANITEKNGPLVGIAVVHGEEDIMLTTDQGVMIRFTVESVSQTGRSTQGVRLMRLGDDAKVATFATVDAADEVGLVEDVVGGEALPAAPEAGVQPAEVTELLERALDDTNDVE